MSIFRGNLFIIVSLLQVVHGIILPGPCPELRPSNFTEVLSIFTAVAVVPLVRNQETYLFSEIPYGTCSSVFFGGKYFQRKDLTTNEYGSRIQCPNGILSFFEQRERNILISSEIQEENNVYATEIAQKLPVSS